MSRTFLCAVLTLSVAALPIYPQTPQSSFQFHTKPLYLPLAVAEEQAPTPVGQTGVAPKLNLIVIEGEGAINNIKQRTAREVIVEVDDENHKPVGGVVLTFFAADQPGGAGGTFANASHIATAVTDSSGRATARNFQPNSVQGSFVIEVTATYLGVVAAKTLIHQTNSAAIAAASSASGASGAAAGAAATHGLSHAAIITIVVVAAAAAVGLGVGLTRGSSSTSNAGTIGVGTGTATVGAP